MKLKTLLLICSCFLAINLQATIRYVKTDGTTPAADAANATSWATACNDLQAVINASEAGDEIRVAVGTYKPGANTATPLDRGNFFMLNKAVSIYGGFPADANENTTMDDRILPSTENQGSILSGDIDNDGTPEGNAYKIFHIQGNIDNTVSFDGFTITGANTGESTRYGGGILIRSCSPTIKNMFITENLAYSGSGIYMGEYASPFISNVLITNNTALSHGAGMENMYSNPTLFNVTISNNSAKYYGGGIANKGSSPTLTDVLISENEADRGGGMNNDDSNPVLFNVTISNNFAKGLPPNARLGGGGIYNYLSSPTLIDVLIRENEARQGGGIYNVQSNPTLINVTISENEAFDGSGISNARYSSPAIYNSIIWNDNIDNGLGNPSYFHSLVQNVTTPDENGNLDGTLDPLFVNAKEGDFRLLENSPCIDAGDNKIYLSTRELSNFDGEKDLAGNNRLFGANIDLGAYEFFSQEPTNIHVVTGQKQYITSYPNPVASGETITLQLTEAHKNGNWTLFHLNGNMIQTGKFENQQEIKIHTAELASGVYFVKLSGKSWQATEVVIVR